MAKKRVLAKVGVRAKKGGLVFYKDGVLYAVEAKRGGTKGAKRKKCAAPAKKKTVRKKAAVKKKAVKKRTAPKKAVKKSAPKKRTAAKKKVSQLKFF